ncbi:conserved hypothetical protein [Chlorobium phaeobacteroides DSM 266]|uniref:Phosphate-selective porin O and P n=2 Tax=Chlorobium phaeobacteroides TaxID=1096 RepID=A1BFA6_CHLPD|nr:conserved hypothetical protein [Chlorobium phaeobacteroides DSM 266]
MNTSHNQSCLIMKKVALLVALAASMGFNNAEAVDWNWSADIRYRYESGLKETTADGEHSRDRHRTRVRLGVYPWINEELSAGVQIATGSDETTSRNETFDDMFIPDSIYLNEAFIDYHPMFLQGNVNLILGKRDVAKTLIVMKDLVWDSDITLEGLTLQFGKDSGGKEKDGLNATAGYYMLNEVNGSAPTAATTGKTERDAYLVAAQLAYTGSVSDLGYKVGAAYYDYVHFDYDNNVSGDAGYVPKYKPEFDYTGKDFNIVELFASVGGPITETLPWKIYGQYAFNTAEQADCPNIDDTKRDAYQIGVQIGDAKQVGQWSLGGEYVSIERDAVTILTDSDRNGGSATNLEGFKVAAVYHLVQNMTLGATYLNFKTKDVDDITNHLFQADVVVKF